MESKGEGVKLTFNRRVMASAAALVASLLLLAIPSAAFAHRPATKAEAKAMVYMASGQDYGHEPVGEPDSLPLRCFVGDIATVVRGSAWGAWTWSSYGDQPAHARQCRTANGITIERKIGGRWYVFWEGSSGYPPTHTMTEGSLTLRGVPRTIAKDLIRGLRPAALGSSPALSLPGFTTVLTSQTVGPAGGTIGPVSCDGGTHILTIPPGAFPTTVQITLFCGNLAQLSPFAFTGFTLESALGVTVTLHGAVYPGTFLRPLTLVVRQASLTAASVVGDWNGASFTLDTNSTAAPGVLTVSFDTDPDFGYMTPTSTP